MKTIAPTSATPPSISIGEQPNLIKTVAVCALGYFVDVYDIQLFAVLRVPSLKAIGIAPEQISSVGATILNAQMLGMIIGAVVWGVLGDRLGRVRALYGSILLYSLGTLACTFVQDANTYALLRFITAIGLAGEIGAAVVLISELMPAEKRGWGITVIGGIGFLGPVVAVLTSFVLEWRQSYVLAGMLGLALLVLRTRMLDAEMFNKAKQRDSLSKFFRIFARRSFAVPFLLCLVMSLPLTFVWNVLNFFSIEISRQVLTQGEEFNQKLCLLLFFFGTSIGDVASGIITQCLKSRRLAMFLTLLLAAATATVLLFIAPVIRLSVSQFYCIYFLLGLSSGCWALATMITSEQFGINIRATASLLMLNLLRAATVPMVLSFQNLQNSLGMTKAAATIGVLLFIASFASLLAIAETHGRDLDFVEKTQT
ncbi:MAG: MFS transporter [Candidatus Obscuribacterales bacterium]